MFSFMFFLMYCFAWALLHTTVQHKEFALSHNTSHHPVVHMSAGVLSLDHLLTLFSSVLAATVGYSLTADSSSLAGL